MTKKNQAIAGNNIDEDMRDRFAMYVGDALSPAEREAVERLCAADEALQLELEAQKLLAAAVREGETLDPSVERSLAAMNARIDVYQQRRR